MKALILLCVLFTTAAAAPKYKRASRLDPKLGPQVQAAEQAWSAAETERDAALQASLWERAALAFGAIEDAPVDVKVKRDAATATVLAWKNALSIDTRVRRKSSDRGDGGKPVPRPLSARDQQLVTALQRYAKYAAPTDPELPGVLFLEATTYRRAGQLDAAIPILRSLVERYPRHEVAGYAANLALDAYSLLGKHDELLALADELAKDAAFLSGRDDLAHTVALIRRRAKRNRAEELARAAMAANDADAAIVAATAYLEIYNADPSARDNDEVLYNAGVTFEQGHAAGQALLSYQLLAKHYPNSQLAARAAARKGRLYANLAMFDKAAEELEQYAKRYGGEKDALQAMSDAVYYRRALGDRAKAIDATQFFIKVFGRKRPQEAAEASWALTALYDDDAAAAIEHLSEYLRTYGATGGEARVVIAHAKLGALWWKQSCPHALDDGLCVKVDTTTTRSCGAGVTTTLRATKRDATKSRRALAAFAEAVKVYERRSARLDDPAARFYYAQAKLALADAELETFLADPAMRGTRPEQLGAWLDARRAASTPLTRQYDAVLSIQDAASAITAAARRGTLAQALASVLVSGPLPRDVATSPEKRAAYCDAMSDGAAPLEASAVDAFAVCLAKSTELGWFDASSRYCEQQLVELRPDAFPPARELRALPVFAAPVLAVEPPLR